MATSEQQSPLEDPEEYREGPAPPHLQETPTLRYIWRRCHINNKNAMIALVGDPGEGKSWAALRLAELLDPGFHAGKVTFRPEELLQRINEDHPVGDVTIADEAGVSMNAKTWWESDQIQIGNILETWRHQNRILIFTLPVFSKLQKDARGLMNVLLTSYGINRSEGLSRWRFQLIETNNKTGDIYEPYPRLPDPETGKTKKYERLSLGIPSDELREEYEQRKEKYTDEINQQAVDEARDDGDDEVDPREVAEEIIEGGRIDEYLSTHGGNGTQYVDQSLIRADHDLSHADAKTVKSLLEREQ